MDTDKVKLIVMNMEMLLKELKYELKDVLKADNRYESIEEERSFIHDYDEVFDE